MAYKYLFAGLLFLISLTFIFTTPGITHFNKSQALDQAPIHYQLLYSVGQIANQTIILKYFPLSEHQPLETRNSAWPILKIELYLAYLATLIAVYIINRRYSDNNRSFLRVSTLFFLNIPLLLLGVALGFTNILAAPFFILALYYFFQKNLLIFSFLYGVAIIFEGSVAILLPLFILKYLSDQKIYISKLALVPAMGSLAGLLILILDKMLVLPIYGQQYLVPNIPWLLTHPVRNLLATADSSSKLLVGLVIVSAIIGIAYFTSVFSTLIYNKSLSKWGARALWIIPFVLIILSVIWTDFIVKSYVLLFIYFSSLFYIRLTANKMINNWTFTLYLFLQSLVFSIFIPNLSLGILIWPSLLLLLLYLFNSSIINRTIFFALGLLLAITSFAIAGSAGKVPVAGPYFQFWTYIYGLIFVFSSLWFIKAVLEPSRNFAISLKWLIILLAVVINISFIAATGSSDTVSWSQYTNASIQAPNPFLAQTLVDQRYPPLNTAIMGIFANVWHFLIGPSNTYAIATKMSIFIFFIVSLIILYLITPKNLTKIDKVVALLTTFSLIIQTQGFADVNIYLVPSLLLAIYFLFKKKYFLSGLFMGITMAIKWQPVILIPLFFLTLIDFKLPMYTNLKRLLSFGLPFIVPSIVCWWLVIINPGGWEAFYRATDYLINGAPALSGQALNLNWIVTYYLHITDPARYFSLEHLGYLNERVPTDSAPTIWKGYLFYLTSLLVIIKYWLIDKKGLIQFVTASLIIFFSHHQLNKSAYEKHIFYTVIFMLFLYLLKPTSGNRKLLILFDIMVIMNLIFFYGFTGSKDVNRLFFSIDLTVIFAIYYLIIFCWVLWRYFRGDLLFDDSR